LPFAESEAGATGLELLLPLTIKWAREAKLPLATALSRITADPARVIGIDAGHLAVNAPADVCIFDPEAWWTVERSSLRSQGKNTPFLGLELAGKVKYTLVRGRVVYED
ncbi:MAG: dihydroorotase, partial [Betaproteobacteria bacterium]